MNQKKALLIIALIIFITLAVTVKIESVPPLWWDEGWTLQVARNWIEQGFYGRIMDGERLAAGLSAHFPVVASAALSFKLLGVGVWQGRLPGVIYFILTLVLLFYLVRNLYNRRIALAMLAVLFLTFFGENHIVLRGREILGETTAIFWLSAGYLLLWKARGKSTWLLLLAIVSWGVAINSKAQVLPFLMASLLTALGFALIKRWWREALIVLLAAFGAWLVSKGMLHVQGWILRGITAPSQGPLQNYYAFTALVIDWGVRYKALVILLTYGLLTLLGVLYALRVQLGKIKQKDLVRQDEIVRTALLGLTVSWLGISCYRTPGPVTFSRPVFSAAFLRRPFCMKLPMGFPGQLPGRNFNEN